MLPTAPVMARTEPWAPPHDGPAGSRSRHRRAGTRPLVRPESDLRRRRHCTRRRDGRVARHGPRSADARVRRTRVAIALVQVLAIFAVLGLDQAIVVQLGEDRDGAAARRILNAGLVVAVAVPGVVTLLAPFWAPPLGFGAHMGLVYAVAAWTVPAGFVYLTLALRLAEDRLPPVADRQCPGGARWAGRGRPVGRVRPRRRDHLRAGLRGRAVARRDHRRHRRSPDGHQGMGPGPDGTGVPTPAPALDRLPGQLRPGRGRPARDPVRCGARRGRPVPDRVHGRLHPRSRCARLHQSGVAPSHRGDP